MTQTVSGKSLVFAAMGQDDGSLPQTCGTAIGWPRGAKSKPLRRPNRTKPRDLTNDELRRIAAQNPPPAEWLYQEDYPF